MTSDFALLLTESGPSPLKFDNLFDYIMAGGPVMVPLGLCSVVALTFAVERWLRLRGSALGNRAFGESILQAYKAGGAKQALEACSTRKNSLSRVFSAGLERVHDGPDEFERAFEDAGEREVRRMTTSLRPFAVIVTLAPLLGLLGTVIGILITFANISSKQGMGKPELLAGGIAHALVATASGLAIAISSQVIYFWFKSKIDRFMRDVEDLFSDVDKQVRATAPAETVKP